MPKASVAAHEGLDSCNHLFDIERDLKDSTRDERYAARLERSRPVLDAFSAGLRKQKTAFYPRVHLVKRLRTV